MKMTSQHGKIREITPLCPKKKISYTQKCIRQIFKCSMHMSQGTVVYKGDIHQKSMPKKIPSLAPKPLRLCT